MGRVFGERSLEPRGLHAMLSRFAQDETLMMLTMDDDGATDGDDYDDDGDGCADDSGVDDDS
eukprot:6481921-Pyramimonas_sp.AAC.1